MSYRWACRWADSPRFPLIFLPLPLHAARARQNHYIPETYPIHCSSHTLRSASITSRPIHVESYAPCAITCPNIVFARNGNMIAIPMHLLTARQHTLFPDARRVVRGIAH
ncbi:hypothetical protein BKA62DRAFT_702960 [Auriculariales sp. MPI-PUGE-AT-0066]|nr:hypothetical protein BKA62DRAFT_702960 [Auriculariales sp. MPI-PUGE-AT-0066]